MKEIIKKGAFEVSNASTFASESYIRAVFKKEAIIILLEYLEKEFCDFTYKKRAKKVLNECGYYSLADISIKLERSKQTVHEWSKKVKDVYVIKLDDRKYYCYSNFL